MLIENEEYISFSPGSKLFKKRHPHIEKDLSLSIANPFFLSVPLQ
jgi:hypothetical protein